MASIGESAIEGQDLARLYGRLQNLELVATDVEKQRQQALSYYVSTHYEGSDSDFSKFFLQQMITLGSCSRLQDDQRISIRKEINTCSRPHLRPLKLMDMPDEVLIVICEHARYLPSIRDFSTDEDDEEVMAAISNIRNLRLTCWRLCNASSHLLLNFVEVHINTKSLSHLEEISLHPTISKGIRSIGLGLDCYDPVLASDIRRFANFHVETLLADATVWAEFDENHPNDPHDVDGSFRGSILPEIKKTGHAVLRSWRNFARDRRLTQPEEHEEDLKYRPLLQRAYREYCRCFADQEMLRQDGLFAQRIAAAMARLPLAKKLTMRDFNGHFTLDRYRRLYNQPDTNSMLEELVKQTLQTMQGWEEAAALGLGAPPAELLFKIPGAIFKAGVSINDLAIAISPFSDISLLAPNDEEAQLLTGSVRNLRNFFFQMADQRGSKETVEARELEGLRKFISALLNTESVETIYLDLEFLWEIPHDHGPPVFGIGSIINSRDWFDLLSLKLFSVPIHYSEIETFVRRPRYRTKMHVVPGAVFLLGDSHLLSGTWADALDLFRAHSSSYTEIHSPWGGETADLPVGKFELIFNGSDDLASKANRYIKGYIPKNPLRDPEVLEEDSSDEEPDDEEPDDEEPNEDEPNYEEPNDGEPTDEEPGNEESSIEDSNDEN